MTTTFSSEERAAMKDRAKELKAKVNGDKDVRAKIAKMRPADRTIADRLHTVVTTNAPDLTPRLWYGMPAYARRDGEIVCFFQSAQKFKTRYATVGFSDKARLDDGDMWPVYFALPKLTDADAARIAELVTRATS